MSADSCGFALPEKTIMAVEDTAETPVYLDEKAGRFGSSLTLGVPRLALSVTRPRCGRLYMAGAVGIEPTMPESKSGALTAWPRPKKNPQITLDPVPQAGVNGSNPEQRNRPRPRDDRPAGPPPDCESHRARTHRPRSPSVWHPHFFQLRHLAYQ